MGNSKTTACKANPAQANGTLPAREPYKYTLLFQLLGDSGVGKSTLLGNIATATSEPGIWAANLTVPLLFLSSYPIQIATKSVHLRLRDFEKLPPTEKRKCDPHINGFIFIFDLSNPESFTNLERWIKETGRHAHPSVQRIVVGNKMDLKRQVCEMKADRFACQLDLPYLEISAKKQKNVFLMVEKMVTPLLEELEWKEQIYNVETFLSSGLVVPDSAIEGLQEELKLCTADDCIKSRDISFLLAKAELCSDKKGCLLSVKSFFQTFPCEELLCAKLLCQCSKREDFYVICSRLTSFHGEGEFTKLMMRHKQSGCGEDLFLKFLWCKARLFMMGVCDKRFECQNTMLCRHFSSRLLEKPVLPFELVKKILDVWWLLHVEMEIWLK